MSHFLLGTSLFTSKMVKGITENNDFNTKRQSQVIDSRRRKILMKKLQKIKLNKSCGNISCKYTQFGLTIKILTSGIDYLIASLWYSI